MYPSVQDGMVVHSSSERAQKSRALEVELPTADQPKAAHDVRHIFRYGC